MQPDRWLAVFYSHMGDGRKLTPDRFAALFTKQVRGLRRSAYLLCGDWQLAEDLVQTTFAKVYAAKGQVRTAVTLPAYLRRTLVRTYIDDSRRRWRGERPSGDVPDSTDRRHGDGQTEDRLVMLEALAEAGEEPGPVVVDTPQTTNRTDPTYTTEQLTALVEAVAAAIG